MYFGGDGKNSDNQVDTEDEDTSNSEQSALLSQHVIYKRFKTALTNSIVQLMLGMLLLLVSVALCLLCWYYCINCLFAVIIVSLLMCACIPGFNVPLWIAVVLLVFGGYSFTSGKMSLTWHS